MYGILYKKFDEKISSIKRYSLSWKHKKVYSFLFKFHFETMVFSIGFVLNWIQNLKHFGIIKVGNKYFLFWLVNMVLKSVLSLEDLMK
jgi:hypothetical protein